MVGRRTGRLAGAVLALLVLVLTATGTAGDGRAGALGPRPYDYFAKSHALLIGIDDYSGAWEPLKKAVEDAREMAKALARQGFTTEVVENPDAAELHARVQRFLREVGSDPEARLLIWFSGHGVTINGEGYLVAKGAPKQDTWQFYNNALSLRTLGQTYTREANARHVLLLLDACFSGTVFLGERGDRPLSPTVELAVSERVRQMIASGTGTQRVSDNGAFRGAVIAALEGRARAADPDGDGYILASDLGQYLHDRITKERGKAQTPQHGKLNDRRFNGGDFVFRIPGGGAAPARDRPLVVSIDDGRAAPATGTGYVDTLVASFERESLALARYPGFTAGLVALLVAGLLVGMTWRNRVRLRAEAVPGTPGHAEIVAQARKRWLAPEGYRAGLRRWLAWMSAKFEDDRAFSAGSYEWLLRLAVIYPIAGVYLVWLVTGENTSGIEGLLPVQTGSRRWLTLVFAAFAIPGAIDLMKNGSLRGMVLLLASSIFVVLGNRYVSQGSFVASIIVVVAVTSWFSSPGTVLNFTGIGASLSLVVSAILGSGNSFWLDPKSWLCVAIAGLSLAEVDLFNRLAKAKAPNWALGVQTGVFAILVIALSFMMGSRVEATAVKSMLTFLIALPLINVVFDWLSLGVTRWLLGGTARGRLAVLNGVLDALAAVALLMGLAVATTAALEGLNTLAFLGGAVDPLIDVGSVLRTLRERPGDPAVWWVYLMLFSTLAPSLVHLFIATGSLLTLGAPGRWLEGHAREIADGFEGNAAKLRRAARFMTARQMSQLAMLAVFVVAVVGGLWGLRLGLPQLAEALLWTAEETAAAFGTPIRPARPDWIATGPWR